MDVVDVEVDGLVQVVDVANDVDEVGDGVVARGEAAADDGGFDSPGDCASADRVSPVDAVSP